MSCDNHSFHTKKLGSAELFLIYFYGFAQCHMIRVTVCLYGFAVIMYSIMYIGALLYKSCLYAGNL